MLELLTELYGADRASELLATYPKLAEFDPDRICAISFHPDGALEIHTVHFCLPKKL